MKKRIIALMLAVGMASGCGRLPFPTTSTAEDASNHATTAQEKKETKDIATKKQDMTQQMTEEFQMPDCQEIYRQYGTELEYVPFGAYYNEIDIKENEDNQILVEGYNRWKESNYKAYLDRCQEEYEFAKSNQEDLERDEIHTYYCVELAIPRMDHQVVSVVQEYNYYGGGAHGQLWYEGVSLDYQTGKVLTLEDLGDVKQDLIQYINDELALYYVEKGLLYDDYEACVQELVDKDELSWYLDGQGLVVDFPQYAIAPYVSGSFRVYVPYHALKQMNEAYIPNSGQRITTLRDYNCYGEFFEEGRKDSFSIEADYDEMGDMIKTLHLVLNDQEFVLEDLECFEYQAYAVSTPENQQWLMVSMNTYNDREVIHLYDINTGKCIQQFWGSMLAACESGFVMRQYVDVLGTYGMTKKYFLSSEGYREDTGLCMLDNNIDRWGPITKMELTVRMKQGDEFVQETLPVGTTIYPMYTDNNGVVGFELEDGRQGEIDYIRQDYQIFIDGISEYDIFDQLPYAG